VDRPDKNEASFGSMSSLANLLDFLPEPGAAFNANNELVRINDAFTSAFGWSLGDLRGSDLSSIFFGSDDMPSRLGADYEQAKCKNKIKAQLIDKKQNLLDVYLSASFVKDANGRFEGTVLVLNDITSELKVRRRLQTMLEISSKLAAYPDLDPLLGFIGGEIKENLEAESASIMVLDPEHNEIYFRLIHAPQEEICRRIKKQRFPADKGLAGHVLQSGQPMIIMDVQNDPRFYGKVDEGSGFVTRSLAYAPMVLNQRHIGVLGAANKTKGNFNGEDQDFLVMLAHTVALAIETARVRDMEKLASTDSLTGLYNRRYLQERLREELHRSCRYKLAFSVVYMDLDKFKQVNDRFGHDEGDKVLQKTAEAISEIARKTDTVARYGGDEFVILLPETKGEDAVLLASRIKNSLDNTCFPKEIDFLTASFGISTFDPAQPIADEELLIRTADQALLEAKRSGRDKVVQRSPS
jgi:diguanylate cyclase (GGDEF)-like protein/PAS domain S-box-containing protein